jgi:hypothetical protein
MKGKTMNDSERVFIFTVHDLVELIESNEVDLLLVVSQLRRQLHRPDPQVEQVYSVLTAKVTEERYFDGKA